MTADPLEFAQSLALQSAELLQSYYDPAGIHASAKPDQTVVTEADLAADKFITDQIRESYPTDSILSEESSHLIKNQISPIWVIDPLDGTTNFSLGLAIWGISIARLNNGFPEIGVLFFPRLGEMYTAKKGTGAFLNHSRIYTRSPDPSQPVSFFACCSRSFRFFNIDIPYKPRILGSSAYTLSMVARGTALLALDATPKIWDLAAAWILVEEAGGCMEAFEGSPAFPISTNLDYSITSFPILAAATQKLLDMGRHKIQRK